MDKTFSTDSFPLASYLLANSCTLMLIDKANPKRALFVFQESDVRKKLTEEFLTHKGKVEPHKFFSAQKDLKQMLYQ